jgi:hypothetical protein
MDDLYRPIDFSEINGYPHVIPERALQKLPCFQGSNVVDARRHVMFVSHCFYKWCHNARHEDIGMKLFIMSFDDDDLDWFMKLKDNQVKTYKELIDAFMEKWKEDEPPDIKTVNSNVKIDASTAPIEELTEVIKATKFICVNQLKILEAHLASASNYIGYSDRIEREFHREYEEELHLEILDESVADQEETNEFEFEVIEYPDNSNPHPPPEEPISSEKIFDNLDKNNKAISLTIPLPTSQPSDDSIQDNGNVEGNFKFTSSRSLRTVVGLPP